MSSEVNLVKNKYQRMSKEEKKVLKSQYYQTNKGKEMKARLNRLVVIGSIGILFSIFLVISGYLSQKLDWATWLLAGILLFFSVFYIVSSCMLRGKVLNQFAIKKK